MTRTITENQLAAIFCDSSNNVIVTAAAGSGKTMVLLERLQRQEADHPPAVVITFTNEAANQLKERLAEHGPTNRRIDFVGTIHGFAKNILEFYFSRPIIPMTEEESEERMTQILHGLNLKVPAKIAQRIVAGRRVKPEDENDRTRLLERAWNDAQLSEGRWSFAGLLKKATEVLHHQGLTVNQYRGHELFVDEFQDVTDETVAFLEAIQPAKRFYVGDANQSIYEFIGGNPTHIVRLRNAAAAAIAANDHDVNIWTHIHLEETFRCCPAIVQAANRVIRGLPTYSHTTPTRLPVWQDRIDFYDAPNTRTEIANTLEWLATAAQEKGFKNTAVLSRTNALAAYITELAKALGMPVKERRKEVTFNRSILLMMEAVAAPNSENAQMRAIAATQGTARANKAFQESFNTGQMLKWGPARDAQAFELRNNLEAQLVILRNASFAENEPNVNKPSDQEWQEVKKVHAMSKPNTMSDLILALKTTRTLEPDQQSESGGLTVTTIHAAKGLEWDLVWMPALNDIYWRGSRDEIQRLVYVGITRARTQLMLTWSQVANVHAFGSEPKPAKVLECITDLREAHREWMHGE